MENKNTQRPEQTQQSETATQRTEREVDFQAVKFAPVPEPVIAAHMPMQED